MFSTEDILRLFLPSWLFDFFELEKFTQDSFRIDVYLSEKKVMPQDSPETLISHGFTDYSIVQDFPVKGKAVYLHLRRRKWMNKHTGEILSQKFDVHYDGTRLTKEFVAFLKESNRK
ncbi:transposase [Dysgonomonas sp. PH5-45]|nr:transposase [Dysgonomonas sp. PH5-45]MDH6389042.1 transposase [Dysgonomonas sp. PH5-37]